MGRAGGDLLTQRGRRYQESKEGGSTHIMVDLCRSSSGFDSLICRMTMFINQLAESPLSNGAILSGKLIVINIEIFTRI